MKKKILKTAVFILVFLISTIGFSYFMNLGNENMTMEMAPATLPVITMQTDGIDMSCWFSLPGLQQRLYSPLYNLCQ